MPPPIYKTVGPFSSVLGPITSGNQQSLVLNASWSILIGCHRSCRPRTNKEGPTILYISSQLLTTHAVPESVCATADHCALAGVSFCPVSLSDRRACEHSAPPHAPLLLRLSAASSPPTSCCSYYSPGRERERARRQREGQGEREGGETDRR